MEKIIHFVNNQDFIEDYKININKEEIEKIKNKLNYLTSIKNNIILTEKELEELNYNEFITILSKKSICKEYMKNYNGIYKSKNKLFICNYCDETKTHPLSELCDKIINTTNSIDTSILIDKLLKYPVKTKEEYILKNEIILSFNFKKMYVKLKKVDLTIYDKKYIIELFKQALNIENNCDDLIIYCSEYLLKDLKEKIKLMTNSYSDEFIDSKSSSFNPFKLSKKGNKQIKRKILNYLPFEKQVKVYRKN